MHRHGEEVDLTTDEARGGSTPHIVRYVLLISLFLAAAAMTIAWVSGALSADQAEDNGLVTNQSVPAQPGTEVGNVEDDAGYLTEEWETQDEGTEVQLVE